MNDFTVIEVPQLTEEYHTVNRRFIIYVAPSVGVMTLSCALLGYLTQIKGDGVFLALPAFLLFAGAAGVTFAIVWTYSQQRNVLDGTWAQHLLDRQQVRDNSVTALQLTVRMNVGNLNTGQQVVLPNAQSAEPIFRSGGRELKDFWKAKGGLPAPEKETYVMPWEDVDGIIELMLEFGPTRRSVLARPLKSGKAVHVAMWTAVVHALKDVGMAEVKDRTPTKITENDAAKMKKALRAGFPDGILVTPSLDQNALKSSGNPDQTSESSGQIVDGTAYQTA